MIFKNLFRRKTRTLLTILGIAVGVASIIGLGALADGMQAGYTNMLSGSKADLVLSQPDAYDIAFSSIDEEIGPSLAAMPEIKNVSAMIEGYSSSEDQTLLIVFGYPEGSFSLERYQLVQGQMLSEAKSSGLRGKPVMLGSAASESLKKGWGIIFDWSAAPTGSWEYIRPVMPLKTAQYYFRCGKRRNYWENPVR